MKKIIFFFLLLTVLGCSANKVSKNHGFTSLETKFEKIDINKSNKNDVLTIIGPPSTKSKFDENKWIYIERKKTNQSLFKLGIKKINKNNILILVFDNRGILNEKKILDLNNMNDVKYVQNITEKDFNNKNILTGVLSTLREKINAPSRNRQKN